MTPLDILTRARRKIASPENWTQGALALDNDCAITAEEAKARP